MLERLRFGEVGDRGHLRPASQIDRSDHMLKGGILWLMGVPLVVVILLVMFVF